MNIDYRSFIQYECEMAKKDYEAGDMKIIVLYKSTSVDKSKCPAPLRSIGIHTTMYKWIGCELNWDYESVKSAFDKL